MAFSNWNCFPGSRREGRERKGRSLREMVKGGLIETVSRTLGPDLTVMVLGDGRSGTTWFGELLNFDGRFKEMFEPFHGERALPHFWNVNFIYPYFSEANRELLTSYFSKVMRGGYINEVVNSRNERLFYRNVLLKDISAHLVLSELLETYPELKVCYVLRNPIDVALSKQSFAVWNDDSRYFSESEIVRSRLSSEQLVYLGLEVQETLRLVRNWAVLYKVVSPLFSHERVLPIFYEDLVGDPLFWVETVYEFWGKREWVRNRESDILLRAGVSSRTASRARKGGSHGRQNVGEDLIQSTKEMLGLFGAEDVYNLKTGRPFFSFS